MTRLTTMTILVLFAAGAVSGQTKSAASSDADRLKQIIDREWEWSMREFPENATYVGDPRYDDRWSDLSTAAIEARKKHARDLAAELKSIDRAKLPEADRINLDLIVYDTDIEIEGLQFPAELIPLHQMNGVHQDPVDLVLMQPKETVADYEKVLKRLRALPALIDQNIALMERGLAAKVVPPKIPLRSIGEAIAAHLVDDPAKSPFWSVAFEEMPQEIPAADQERLRAEARKLIGGEVKNAYTKLNTFWTERYFPAAREAVGISAVPDGAKWYQYQIRRMTTTDLTPEQIHQTGLAEVKRIRGEMERIREQSGFKGTLEEFFTYLRTDPQFFFTDPQMLLMTYRDIAKRIDPGLTKLFGTLPRLPYGVLPVPEYSEKTQTTAYYWPGSPEGGRPGVFYANLYDLKSRPKWEMEALTVHEAVPGHHLQIALAQELDVPNFRRHSNGYTAFVEGWGLYSESLGHELGLYKDPYSHMGQLTYEMWRAIRLVVDTGMHAKGWTRQQAIDYFKANSSKAEHDIAVEVDRYIVWPGQALAYKLGELKIKELRVHASKELGEKFDVRVFHDRVLEAGALPLSLLDRRIREWVVSEKSRG